MSLRERMFAVTVVVTIVGTVSVRAYGDAPRAINADLLLQGGQLHLGDGNSPRVGDVAIKDDRIVAVGRFPVGKVLQVVDCRGFVVSPGFIDLHNHSDRQVLQKGTRAVMNYVTQGCTTIVTGNCGSGPIDVGSYYDEIDRRGVGVNVAHLLPQGGLRRNVIGNDQRRATAAELRQMGESVAQGMRDGAWGMSTGLIYVPSSYANTDELAALAEVVGRHGGIYASHIRNENVQLLSAVEEAIEIGRRGKLPVHISHFKSSGKDSWGLVRVAAETIQQHRDDKFPVTADQYPYTASSTSLEATLIPTWARAGGRRKMLVRLADAEQGPRIQSAIEKKLRELDGGQRLQIAFCSAEPSWSGKRVSEIARERKVPVLELILDVIRRGGASIVNHSINEADARYVMTLPWVATASDGRAYLPGGTVPHPRNYGTFPRKIGHYALQEKVLSLDKAIRSCTGLPADILGLPQRGYLRPGYFADVVVWDPEKVIDAATFEDPHNYSRGIQHVFVNGRSALRRGLATGALFGKALRHKPPIGETSKPTTGQRERIDKLFAKWDRPDSPGMAVGVVKDGHWFHKRGYGTMNLDYGKPVGSETVFYLASVSKQFVAACVALLEMDGKLKLEDDVRKYVPELPASLGRISIAHLLHHTSGLRDYFSLMESAGKRASDVHRRQDLLQLVFLQKELNFAPGTEYRYCNSGYLLLAEIVERVSKMSLAQYAEKHIFEPLGMRNTRFHDDRTRVVKERAISYQRGEMGFRVAYLANWEQVGSGGLLSSLDDLLLWVRNFQHLQVGGQALRDRMHRRGKLRSGNQIDYALGLVHGEYQGHPTVGHNGSFMGFRTSLLRFPTADLAVMVLSNLGDVNAGLLAKQVAAVCLEKGPE